MAAPVAANQAPPVVHHFTVQPDGKLYIGNKACIVKLGNKELTERAELERIADLFNRTVNPIVIEDNEVWKFKPQGITVFTRSPDGKLEPKEKTIGFKSDAAKAEFTRELEEFLRRLNAAAQAAQQAQAPAPAPAPAAERPPAELTVAAN